MTGEGKRFFFAKKKQKTFVPLVRAEGERRALFDDHARADRILTWVTFAASVGYIACSWRHTLSDLAFCYFIIFMIALDALKLIYLSNPSISEERWMRHAFSFVVLALDSVLLCSMLVSGAKFANLVFVSLLWAFVLFIQSYPPWDPEAARNKRWWKPTTTQPQ